MSEYNTVLSSLARMDVDPAKLQKQIDGVRTGLLELSQACRRNKKDAERAVALMRTINELPIRLVAGKKKPFGTVLKDLRNATPLEALAEITAENFYRTGPFLLLGNMPVGVNRKPDATALRDMFPVFGASANRRLPTFGRHRRSHTFWVYESKSWWSALIYNHYSASTKTTATGWDACDQLGGQYASAKEACATLVVPPASDPSSFIIAFLKTAACNYAANAPETPFPSIKIDTIACSCLVKGADGSCDPIKRTLEGFELDESCNQKVRMNTAGPVEVTHSEWSGSCLGVTSRHFVEIVPGVKVQDYWC